jgi:hypothetical protein
MLLGNIVLLSTLFKSDESINILSFQCDDPLVAQLKVIILIILKRELSPTAARI